MNFDLQNFKPVMLKGLRANMRFNLFGKLKRVEYEIKKEGLFLAVMIIFKYIINKLFSVMVFKRLDVNIDVTAKIRGRSRITIGDKFSSGRYLWLEAVSEYNGGKFNSRILIKDNVSFSDFNHIGAVNYIEIGNGVLFGSKCYVTDHNHGIYEPDKKPSSPQLRPADRPLSKDKKVIIGDNVWLGDNVIVLPGVTIGHGAIIGANAVVTDDIPHDTIAVGIPARVIKVWNKESGCWEKTKKDEFK